ncbi:hypothetical protein HAX54_024843, partial [Datura stramonium]|nr:hypothetical protein [Datura stramonium]
CNINTQLSDMMNPDRKAGRVTHAVWRLDEEYMARTPGCIRHTFVGCGASIAGRDDLNLVFEHQTFILTMFSATETANENRCTGQVFRLDKAQKRLPVLNINSPNAPEATRAQLTSFNSPLSNLMDCTVHGENQDDNIELPTSNYIVEKEQKKDMNLYKLKEASINFDLNSRSSYNI